MKEQIHSQVPLLVSAPDAAKLAGVSERLWWSMHSASRIPMPMTLGTRARRWSVLELRQWVEAGCPNRDKWEAIKGRPEKSIK